MTFSYALLDVSDYINDLIFILPPVFILVVPFNQLMSYMLGAYDLNMAGGDYAFVAVEQTITEYTTTELWKAGDGRDEDAKVAMESLIYVSAE